MPISPLTKELRAFKRKIGRNLNRHRTRQRLTLHQLSRKAGFSPYMIDAYELGKYDIRLDGLIQLASALQVPIDDLFI